MYQINGKIAVITGGAKGIGYATGKRLLLEGARVFLLDYDEAALEKALDDLSPLGDLHVFVCDVTSKERVRTICGNILKNFGPVSILVNNAGTVVGKDFIEGTDEEWERTIAINLTAPVYVTRVFLPAMYEQNDGRVVNISSAAGLLGVPKLAVYCATKWAIWGLTESLRLEAFNRKKRNVKFSSVHPCFIASGLFAGAKLGFLGNLIAPLLKDHDVVAEAIVESAIKRGRRAPKRPRTVNLLVRLRGILPDFLLEKLIIILGIPQSMQNWTGHAEKKDA